jgi:cytochrome c553
MNKLTIIGLGALCLAPLAFPLFFASADEFPSWAYPVDAPQRPGGPQAARPKDDGKQYHVPDSDVALTRAEIEGKDAVPDWHPTDHPAMPDIVRIGKPGVRACAYCHQPNGAGRPDSTSLAGLPVEYIKHQIENFKTGARKGSEPERGAQKQMIEIASKVSPEDVEAAANYFSSLTLPSYLKVAEADTVPKTIVASGILAKDPEGGTEPIGKRIIEVPEDLERAELRDSHTTYIAYVPKGSLAKGKNIVTTGGGKTTACATCHGQDLHGAGDVPHIAGRSPSYIIRQLYDIQHNNRTGSVTFMQQVVQNLEQDDMIAVASYVASLQP